MSSLVKNVLYCAFFEFFYFVLAEGYEWGPDLEGTYCTQCCDRRKDDCSMPILGTLCYCDQFCRNQRSHTDCCPDYGEFCMGELRKRDCEKDGVSYQHGSSFKINCNKCMCEESKIMCTSDTCLIDTDIINRVNYGRYGWRASNVTKFYGRTLEDGKLLLGTFLSRRKVADMRSIAQIISRNLPEEFDSRNKWKGRISRPADQSWCASSYVFSTVSVASDRTRIMTKGRVSEALSYQNLLSCIAKPKKRLSRLNIDSPELERCSGGHLTRAWAYLRKNGIVTESCYPLTRDTSRCHIRKRQNATEATCVDGRRTDKIHRMAPAYRVSTEQGIMQEIMENGPVQAIMRVTRDFFLYQDGIYKCQSDIKYDKMGVHSVRIIGWGQEYQEREIDKFWIVANSWGEDWGENGYFRIRKGKNDCGIEDFILGATIGIRSPRLTFQQIVFNQI